MPPSNRIYAGELSDGPSTIRIGPFLLDERIGQGSMGEVWRANHVDQNVQVAVKVILTAYATERKFRRAFRQEALAVAELYHPFIVDVFDYGSIDEVAVESSAGHFELSSPYLVMSHAPMGSLDQHLNGPVAWPVVRLITVALLDALAHSHARGLLHRDIKPGNVLLTEPDRQVGVALTDFGLAYALRSSQGLSNWHHAAGTPEYMSPEQLNGDWRSYGPHTDLYGLGCLLWKLVTGDPPYTGDNLVQLARAHIDEPLPELPSHIDVPEKLEPWLHRLLQPQPSQRFSCAADAARRFARFAGDLRDQQVPERWSDVLEDSATESDTCLLSTTSYCLHRIFEQPSQHHYSGPKSLPPHWHRNEAPEFPVRLIDTGSGLYRLRRTPLIGREPQRDRLWNRLRQSVDHSQIDATFITGPAGIGKDRLARWLCERGAELGAVDIFHARHEPDGGAGGGLLPMIEREFALDGLTHNEVEEFFRTLLTDLGADDPYEWEVLTEILRPGDDEQRVVLSTGRQRYMAMVRLFEYLASQRPLVLWLEDAHLNLETLRFIRQLLDRPGASAPIHVVATLRNDQLAERGLHRETVDATLTLPGAERIELEPMSDRNLRRIIEEVLFIDPATAYEAVHRAGGNPLYALQMVGSWIDDGRLEPASSGYRLRDGAQPTPSGEWIDVWTDAAERLTDAPHARQALQLAAILGNRFHPDVWQQAADAAGVNIPDELIDTLLRRKHLHEQQDRLVFSQALLREALLQSARNDDVWQKYCHICAQALNEQPSLSRSDEERMAFLFAHAGRPLEAAGHLADLAEYHRQQSNYGKEVHLTRRALDVLGEPTTDESRRLTLRLLAVLKHGWAGLYKDEQALAAARRGLAIAEQLDDDNWRAEMYRLQIGPLNMLCQFDEAWDVALKARKLLKTSNESDEFKRKRVSLERLLAHVARNRGDLDRAIHHVERARQLAESLDDPRHLLETQNVELKTRIARGDDVDIEKFEQLYHQCRRRHLVAGMVQMANDLAELARLDGDFETARHWYERSIEAARYVAPYSAVPARLNLALIDVERGNYATAATRARRVIDDLRRKPRPKMAMYGRAATLPWLAHRGDLQALSTELNRIHKTIEDLQLPPDHDLWLCLHHTLQNLNDPSPKNQKALQQTLEDLLEQMKPSNHTTDSAT